ncbi:hypothetical protein ACIGXM_29150 [Kitasatospora sp. NPDC052896]|uniref:hypothetical protein n=1 Tax=Kitasatospora sp. NPDC052896 TaxID=3364061 RepID=UPI0037C9E4C5
MGDHREQVLLFHHLLGRLAGARDLVHHARVLAALHAPARSTGSRVANGSFTAVRLNP